MIFGKGGGGGSYCIIFMGRAGRYLSSLYTCHRLVSLLEKTTNSMGERALSLFHRMFKAFIYPRYNFEMVSYH